MSASFPSTSDVAPSPPLTAPVEALLGRMTLTEKVGQMTQLTLEAVSLRRGTATTTHALDPDKLRHAVVEYGVGSFLNVWDVAHTPEQWHELIMAIQQVALEETRLGIPVLYGIDAVHGAHYTVGATLFPQNLGMAATWSPELVRKTAALTAREVRACGIPWNFAPVVDLGRQPLWSRFFETFGEDVHLASRLAAAAVDGYQGDDLAAPDRTAACVKHFVGYGFPLSGKDRTPAWIPEHFLREYFLPPFTAALATGARTLMVNSGEINGVPVHASRYLLTDLLRDELGFTGVTVTDWEDIIKLHTIHRVAESERDAVRLAVLAGVDMSMTPFTLSFHDHLVDLVNTGEVPMARIDEAVRRILTLKMELGLFDAPIPDASRCGMVGQDDGHALSLEAARASITLLENRDAALPLEGTPRLLVTGPAADRRSMWHGAWSYTWQGTEEDVYPPDAVTFVQALADRLGPDHVRHVPGATQERLLDVDAAVEAARSADVVLACIGETAAAEKPGDIEDLSLPAAQCELVEALLETGTPVVLVLVQARPRSLGTLAERAAAVVLTYQPGPYGPEALADILLGDVNPSGKLPFTYPRHPSVSIPYDHKQSDRLGRSYGVGHLRDMDGFAPLWPFGHGLHYTTFAYGDLTLERAALPLGQTLRAHVTVTNTGDRAGHEVVQWYVRDDYASLTPPVQRLRGFERVALAPGEERRVTLELDTRALAFVAPDNRHTLEPGSFELRVGGLARPFRLTGAAPLRW